MNNFNYVKSRFPKFLALLFFVEMWERFSYYGMRALLVLFLVSSLGFSDPKAYSIYSLFAALSYAGPVVGGYLADKLFGFRKMVMMGAMVLVLGHLMMFMEVFDTSLVYLGLGMISVGTGLFKGNITNLLGECYAVDDPERDRGFTLFYVSVNIGSSMAAISCSIIAKIYGWHYGFGLAAVGIILGLSLFLTFQNKILKDKGLPPKPSVLKKKIFKIFTPFMLTLLLAIFAAYLFSMMLQNSMLFSKLLAIVGLIVTFWVLKIIREQKGNNYHNMIVLLLLIAFQMLFYAVELQLGSLMNLFAQRNIAKTILGYDIPAAFSQAINPFSIIVFGPLLSVLFVRLGLRWEIKRFGFGIFLMILCFLTLYIGCFFADDDGQVSAAFLIIGIAFMGVGEIFIAPVVYSLLTILVPIHLRGFMMGFMLLSLSFSNLAGIIIAKFMSVPLGTNGEIDTLNSLGIYQSGFLKIVIFNCVVLLAFILVYPYINRITVGRKRIV